MKNIFYCKKISFSFLRSLQNIKKKLKDHFCIRNPLQIKVAFLVCAGYIYPHIFTYINNENNNNNTVFVFLNSFLL